MSWKEHAIYKIVYLAQNWRPRRLLIWVHSSQNYVFIWSKNFIIRYFYTYIMDLAAIVRIITFLKSILDQDYSSIHLHFSLLDFLKSDVEIQEIKGCTSLLINWINWTLYHVNTLIKKLCLNFLSQIVHRVAIFNHIFLSLISPWLQIPILVSHRKS